ncbi:carbohydrate deacetylase [Vibrio artabrorum]|uniref:carbohydrate deacetylase n=1 Tax=Vibrio artabrorum TaxID=446374 RepID=UPI003551EAAA
MKLRVINNADDFGYSNAINYGIIDAHRYGILNSATIMAHMDGFDHAVELSKQNPQLAIGVHCTLTCGRPLLSDHKTLTEKCGTFKKISFWEQDDSAVDDDEVYREFKAQIEKVIASGIQPTHLDSHHHIHRYKNNMAITIRLAKEFGIAIRNVKTVELKALDLPTGYTKEIANIGMDIFMREAIPCNSLLIEPYLRKGNSLNKSGDLEERIVDEIIDSLESAKGNKAVEIMWHPAYIDREIMENSSFNIPRIYETKALTNKRLIEYFNSNCELCTFKEL